MEGAKNRKRQLQLEWNNLLKEELEVTSTAGISASFEQQKSSMGGGEYQPPGEELYNVSDTRLDEFISRQRIHIANLGPKLRDKGEKLKVTLKRYEDEKQRRKSRRVEVGDDCNRNPQSDLQVLRRREPEHFLLKVESFSESKIEKYESDEFEVGGYKWRLVLYPEGDKKRNGSDHISLYLSICDTKNLPHGWEVEANFSLFVYNFVSEKYLTRNMESAMRFNWLKTELGFSQLLPLDYFKETSNGYLFDDTCVIGAEIYVISSAAKRQTLSMINATNNNIFTWKIDQFSTRGDRCLYSDNFKIGDVQWKLALYPKGSPAGIGNSVSVVLHVADDEPTKLATNLNASAEGKLRIRNQVNTNHVEYQFSKVFSHSKTSLGYYDIMELSDVNDKSKGFLVNDTLLVEVEFTMAGMIKNFK